MKHFEKTQLNKELIIKEIIEDYKTKEIYMIEKKLKDEINNLENSDITNLLALATIVFSVFIGIPNIDNVVKRVMFTLLIGLVLVLYYYGKRRKQYLRYYKFYLDVVEDIKEFGLEKIGTKLEQNL